MAFRRLPRFRLLIDLENFSSISLYPRKVGRRCVSPFIPDVMFRPFSYCHVPSYLGNRQLKQDRICVIGSFFYQESQRFHFLNRRCVLVSMFSPSLLSASTASRVVLAFIEV